MSQALDDLYARLAAIDKRLQHIETLERPSSANMMLWSSPAVLCTNQNAQTIHNNDPDPIVFQDADTFDTDGMHNPGVNPSYITIQTDGAYLFLGGGTWSSGSGSGTRRLWLLIDGTTTIPGSYVLFRQTSTADAPGMITAGVALLSAGQYVELIAYQNSGIDLAFSAQRLAAFRVPGWSVT